MVLTVNERVVTKKMHGATQIEYAKVIIEKMA